MPKIEIEKIKNIIPVRKRMKVLFVASEAAPFAKAGGMGDIIYSLPLALKEIGVDARVMIPRYATIDSEKYKLRTEVEKLKVPTDQPGKDPFLVCNVKKYIGKEAVITYFLENMEYYEQRANVYGYSDDHIRWALLCRGCLEFFKTFSWKPDIIVASDWQTGLISNYLEKKYSKDPDLSKISTVFIIHNLLYQGMRDFRFIQETEKDFGKELIPDFFNPRLAKLNWLLRGVLYSDVVTTVSPTYAKEIMTQEYGEGLEKIFSENKEKVFGILNGINHLKNSPAKTSHIPINYNISSIGKRNQNKAKLQERFNLPEDPNVFLMAVASRFTEQKGLDIIEQIMPILFKNIPCQIIFLGDGEPRYKEAIKKAEEEYPDQVGSFFEFDQFLPYFIFSGADALLMPSKFEPCGITQMEAMKFGCIPIARKTGGLVDTIIDFDCFKEKGEGFLFQEYDPIALYTAIVQAYTCFNFKKSWNNLTKRAMKKDFSWNKSAKEYLKIFNEIKKCTG